MNEVEKFFNSEQKLREFFGEWSKPLDDRCKNNSDNQIRAAYYLWARYSMSIRTLEHLCDPKFLPDLFVIARSCLEFRVSLKALVSDEQLAKDYLDFEKHVKSRWFNQLQSEGDLSKTVEYRQKLSELGVKDPNEYRWDKWCVHADGITGLMKDFGDANEMKLYSQLSHFAHGSVIALQVLENTNPQGCAKFLDEVIKIIYLGYILSTKSFLNKAWGPIITPDSEACKNSFVQVANVFGSKS